MTSPAEHASSDLVAEANPERALFVEMLTRDIDLIPAIMDLIDNSIDGARALETDADGTGFWVELQVSQDRFEIRDNCGGIDLDIARQYAFRFGRPSAYKGTKRSVGQFGVGMKRALFKLGDTFSIESRAATTRFEMTVDVNEWVADKNPVWTFAISSASRDYDPATDGRGTTILLTDLHDAVQEDLADRRFLSLLREQIRFRHQGALAEGIRIRLNGEWLAGLERELLSGPDFAPINRSFVVASEHGDVAVRIIAGITDVERREVGRNDGDAENFRGGSEAGWWIFCNDRLLLMREKSRLTGWGENLPNYHPQYREFRGYVYLSAAETAALPWNTTKTGLDEESRVWRQVQAQVKIAGAEVVSVLNRIKRESETALNDADMPTVTAMKAATLVSTEALPPRENFVAPAPRRVTGRPVPKRPRTKKLQFEVPLKRFEDVAQKLNTSVVAEVGRRTFEYYYQREVESE
ncbi:ATP-binding protein [Isoptericola sp. b490]|uniref:ATP-binding protein n=1 Tax=Actinotalea lenta TaxID=3064654 RepID=UPI00271391F1|nr:ATP-binding protein [Isoptericola sp. b490]MDO8119724.1 ATP-binding protein [Isoptericola sp. b490]